MKILSNKKYNELILKSCEGMFGAVTDDMLLRENALLYEENKQLKEQLENDIDRYEDTISYQLGFDKGKEYLQQRIDKAIKYIKDNCYDEELKKCDVDLYDYECDKLLEILGDKENESS